MKPTGRHVAFAKALGCLALGAVLFSSNGAVGAFNFQDCGNAQQEYDEFKPAYEKNPGYVLNIYIMGENALCVNKIQEGMALLERSVDGGHVQVNYFMGGYHENDQSFDFSKHLTEDPENFNAMLFYFNRAADLIEGNPQYPEGTYEDIPYLEERNRISARVFVSLPDYYFTGYSRAMGKILEDSERTEYTDTLEVFNKMRVAAERCLQRPAPAVWKHKQGEIGNALRVRCGAVRDFAIDALPLEKELLGIARQCAGLLKECSEHKEIVNDLIDLANTMRETANSVPQIDQEFDMRPAGRYATLALEIALSWTAAPAWAGERKPAYLPGVSEWHERKARAKAAFHAELCGPRAYCPPPDEWDAEAYERAMLAWIKVMWGDPKPRLGG